MPNIYNAPSNIELSDQFLSILNTLEYSSENVFLTGRAGTGKSTLLDIFRKNTKKNIIVLAPTGVAALNVQGQTIHSFFGFRPDITVEKTKKLRPKDKLIKTCKKLDTIVIDEVSMVRADLLDCVDKFMRLHGKDKKQPFGGVQMIFIGDLYQLPPVVTNTEKEIFKTEYDSPYFFSAKVFDTFSMELLELDKIYRQKDDEFIDLLNAVRNNSITDDQIDSLNQRLDYDFEEDRDKFYIYLTTTNDLANAINLSKLNEINDTKHNLAGSLTGNFEQKSLPTALSLDLKVGAQIMMMNNDPGGRWVNGSIGQIIGIQDIDMSDEDEESEKVSVATIISVRLDNGRVVEVTPNTWEMYNYFFDESKGFLDSEVVGTFTQFPIKLAWAVTIHKSQGKTFERVILDIGRGTFAHGQIYVALSRCTSFDGLILKKPVSKRHILMDQKVVDFAIKYKDSKRTIPLVMNLFD